MSETALSALSRSKTVFFLPLGGCEPHGPHLPLGLDLRIAEELSHRLIKKLNQQEEAWNGIVMPSLPLALESHSDSGNRLLVRSHVYRDAIVDWCLSLYKEGWVWFVALTGLPGPKHLTVLDEARRLVWRKSWLRGSGKKPTLISLSAALVSPKEVFRAPFFSYPTSHGAFEDTSLALCLFEKPLHPLPPDKAPPWTKLECYLPRRPQRDVSYWGHMQEPHANEGEQILQKEVQFLFPKLLNVLQGKSQQSQALTTWYSVFLIHKSLFVVWALTFAIILTWVGIFYLYTTDAAKVLEAPRQEVSSLLHRNLGA